MRPVDPSEADTAPAPSAGPRHATTDRLDTAPLDFDALDSDVLDGGPGAAAWEGGADADSFDTDVLDTDVLPPVISEETTDPLRSTDGEAVADWAEELLSSERELPGLGLNYVVDARTSQDATNKTHGAAPRRLEQSTIDELRRALSAPVEADQATTAERTADLDTATLDSARSGEDAARGLDGGVVDPFLVTGLHLWRVDGDARRRESAPEAADFDIDALDASTAAGLRRIDLELDGERGSLRLEGAWAQFVEEMVWEVRAEPMAEHRSVYLYLLAHVLRLHGGLGATIAGRLEEVAARGPRPLRSMLLSLLVKHWREVPDQFFEALEQLERVESRHDAVGAGLHRASIAAARLREGDLSAPAQKRLEDLTYQPETLLGLCLQAVLACRMGSYGRAGHLWAKIGRRVKGEPRGTLFVVGAYLLGGTPRFFDFVWERFELESAPQALVQLVQHEATGAGDHLVEAVVLRHLVTRDIAHARQLKRDGGVVDGSQRRRRLRRWAAARFFRLSVLIEVLGPSVDEEEALSGLTVRDTMRDAVALDPGEPLYLRRLARWACRAGDFATAARAYEALAAHADDAQLAAYARAQEARALYAHGAESQSVRRRLDDALRLDPACLPARLAIDRLTRCGFFDGDDTLDEPLVDARVRGDDTERRLAAQADWAALADYLGGRLRSATSPQQRARAAYRLAQIESWHRDPRGVGAALSTAISVAVDDGGAAWARLECAEVLLAQGDFGRVRAVLESLIERAAHPGSRAMWRTELGVVREQFLGSPTAALEAYDEALGDDPGSVAALLGVLRCDKSAPQRGVAAVLARLEAGVDAREADVFANELFLRAEEAPQAAEAIASRFPALPTWQFLRLCRAAERDRLDAEAVRTLRRVWTHRSAAPLLETFEDVLGVRRELSRGDIDALLAHVGLSPVAEGPLVRAMYHARRLGDVELEGTLAAVRARRAASKRVRVTELALLAAMLAWQDRHAGCVQVCERIAGRTPGYLPAIKLAKLISAVDADWAALVHWSEREAEATRVEQVAVANRVVVSEVQRRHLGNFEASRQQFEKILDRDPCHADAFGQLRVLLLQRGDVDALLERYERRLEACGSDAERVEVLNEMGDVAMHRGQDRQAAVGYFRRSLDLDPSQLRILRILADLHEQEGRAEAAIACYRAATELTDSEELLARLWMQVGDLFDARGRHRDALDAYERALRARPSLTRAALALAMQEVALGEYENAMLYLQRVESSSNNPDLVRRARIERAALFARLDRAPKQVTAAYRDVLTKYPDARGAVDAAVDYLQKSATQTDPVDYFETIAYRALREMNGRPLQDQFDLAVYLGHADRAFRLAAVGEWLGRTSPSMKALYEALAAQRDWPTRPLPRNLAKPLVPTTLLGSFLDLLRATEPALRAAHPRPPSKQLLAHATSVVEPQSEAMELAFQWPSLMGLGLDAAWVSGRKLEGGVGVVANGNVQIVVDKRWLQPDADPTPGLVALGRKLAAESLGVGAWRWFAPAERPVVLARIMRIFTPGWNERAERQLRTAVDWRQLEQRLGSGDVDAMAAAAQRLSGRVGSRGLGPQFELLELCFDRYACVLLDDPNRFLPHARRLGSQSGIEGQPWTFLFTTAVGRLRQALGLAHSSLPKNFTPESLP